MARWNGVQNTKKEKGKMHKKSVSPSSFYDGECEKPQRVKPDGKPTVGQESGNRERSNDENSDS